MKVFILEDSRHRIKKFEENLKEHDIIIKTNTFDATKYIMENYFDYDVMMLDHDLGHRIFCSKYNKNTGHTFIKAIKNRIYASKKLKVIIIHSWNPFGAYRMYKELKDCNKIIIWKPCRWPI